MLFSGCQKSGKATFFDTLKKGRCNASAFFILSSSSDSHAYSHNGAANAAHDMGNLRDIIAGFDARIDLAAYIDNKHQNQGYGYAASHAAQGGHNYHHEHYAAGSHKGTAGEEKALNHTGDQGRYNYCPPHIAAAVALFKGGANHQHKHQIAREVGKVAMSQPLLNLFHRDVICQKQTGTAVSQIVEADFT